jgi:TonB family protein
MAPEIYKKVRELFDEGVRWPEAETSLRLQSARSSEPELFEAVVQLLNAQRSYDSVPQDHIGSIHAGPRQRIGRYLITGELGRGAMGVVYDAEDPTIGRKVAIKVIHLQAFTDAGEAQFLRERLFREARSAGQLSHPGIVTVFDVGQDGDLAFFAMERVEGVSLDRILASGRRYSPAEALEILQKVAVALDYAHRNGVIHRDIKPANIMVDQGVTPKIADFGIAKIVSTDLTLTGVVMGTPSYMSPEQIEALPLDGRSDQFSLGVLAYELLTGNRPFDADSLASMVHMILYGDRPSARDKNPKLPQAVDGVLYRSLARLPRDRFQSCKEFVAALEEAFYDAEIQLPGLESPTPQPSLNLPDAERGKGRSVISIRNLLLVGLMVACAVGFLVYDLSYRARLQVNKQVPALPESSVRSNSNGTATDQSHSHVRDSHSTAPFAGVPTAILISEPKLVSKVRASYSEIAKKLGVEGRVSLTVDVTPDGTVSNPRVDRSLGYGLDQKAIEALLKWRFKPAMKYGQAVSYPIPVPFDFRLAGSKAPGAWSLGPMVFKSEDGVSAPVLRDGEKPKAVPELSNESVVLEFTVDPEGLVKNVGSINGPNSMSDFLAGYLYTWTFQPAMKGGRPTEVTGRVRFFKGKVDETAEIPLFDDR